MTGERFRRRRAAVASAGTMYLARLDLLLRYLKFDTTRFINLNSYISYKRFC